MVVRSSQDYEDFDGVRIATRVVERIDGSLLQIAQITSLEWDAVDPDIFEPPASIKKLRK